jgi:hypothetical protein
VRQQAPLDVNAIVHEVLTFEQEALREHGIVVQTAAAAPLPEL